MRERAVLLNQFGSSSPRSPAGNLACAGTVGGGQTLILRSKGDARSPLIASSYGPRFVLTSVTTDTNPKNKTKRRIDWAYSSTPRMVSSTPRLQGSVHPSISARRVLVYWDLESETSLLEDELVDSI
ncbi:hypothetical protein ACJJTC_006657 [Scirpophaga incertulas]